MRPKLSRWRSFLAALNGLRQLFASQRNAQIEAACGTSALVLGFWFGITRTEWLAVVFAIGLVFVAEALNTAIEEIADALHPEESPKIGLAKDLASSGVLLAALAALVIGLIVFVPYVL